jgi:hypothetical protein
MEAERRIDGDRVVEVLDRIIAEQRESSRHEPNNDAAPRPRASDDWVDRGRGARGQRSRTRALDVSATADMQVRAERFDGLGARSRLSSSEGHISQPHAGWCGTRGAHRSGTDARTGPAARIENPVRSGSGGTRGEGPSPRAGGRAPRRTWQREEGFGRRPLSDARAETLPNTDVRSRPRYPRATTTFALQRKRCASQPVSGCFGAMFERPARARCSEPSTDARPVLRARRPGLVPPATHASFPEPFRSAADAATHEDHAGRAERERSPSRGGMWRERPEPPEPLSSAGSRARYGELFGDGRASRP